MNIIYLLIPLSLLLLSLAVWAFFWAVRNNQFDDLETPALDVLEDEDDVRKRRSSRQAAGSGENSTADEDRE
ncbi:cbb3-type cytochrome oxidase assembly protein CcoS [Wenzhouxiangella sp. XN79A]|uniref:cbb3-type cytochrome oxidase assembly protein CcoS n=1 Tax=Wenzhouxiangella sp. XN79A TaxID=2724193 RepID=UPI00144ABF46|nr:cbb3-type cytochrome oxidase assembly protein CcoS [Wenzhouxiangella sp. XN79A]NKI35386.1 cbb3-type cytochrome oxidase assembly protein CcoS [Wenzhouxiangella sp. XN79A]